MIVPGPLPAVTHRLSKANFAAAQNTLWEVLGVAKKFAFT